MYIYALLEKIIIPKNSVLKKCLVWKNKWDREKVFLNKYLLYSKNYFAFWYANLLYNEYDFYVLFIYNIYNFYSVILYSKITE